MIYLYLFLLPHKDHPNKLNNQFNLKERKNYYPVNEINGYICFFQMSAIIQTCLGYNLAELVSVNRINIKLQQWWIIINYGILKYFPRDYFFYQKANMPYSVIEGTEHKHTYQYIIHVQGSRTIKSIIWHVVIWCWGHFNIISSIKQYLDSNTN